MSRPGAQFDQHAELEHLRRENESLRAVVAAKQVQDPILQSSIWTAGVGHERLFQLLIEHTPLFIFWKDLDGAYMGCNRRFLEEGGYTLETLIGRTDLELGIPVEQARFFRQIDAEVIQSGKPVLGLVERITRPDGRDRWLLTNKVPLQDASGSTVGLLGAYEDITDRIDQFESLRHSEARLDEAQRLAKLAHFRVDFDRDLVEWSDSLFDLLHVDRSSFSGKIGDRNITHPDDRDRVYAAIDRAITSDTVEEVTARMVRGDGEIRHMFMRVRRAPDCPPDGRIMVGVIQDINERVEAEQATNQLLMDRGAMIERMQLYLDNMPTACLHNDTEFRIMEWNPGAERLFGFSRDEAVGRHPFDLIVPENRQAAVQDIQKRLASGERNVYVLGENLTKDGRLISCEWISSPMFSASGDYVGSISMCMDVSSREQLKNQLLRVQRMESIGRVAGGIAHDFNNILTAIMGFSDFASRRLPQDSPAQPDLIQVRRSADRAAELTSQLLAFARKQPREARAVDPNEIVLGMEPMLHRVLGPEVELHVEPAQGIWMMHADPSQVEQVIMNLAINARDAMPEGGLLSIETANVTLDASYASQHAGVLPGDYVSLTVTDTGIGMSAETQAMVFEPFYSTKEPGKGTGLGLATCYGIAQQSGGHIWLYSEPGQGATFKVYLPKADGPVIKRAVPEGQLKLHVGTETILLVEDDELVREYATGVLESLGYKVLIANSGQEALDLAEGSGVHIHLLLTDVVMPRMRGTKLAETLRNKLPKLKVIYASGYPGNALKQQDTLAKGSQFLQKPYSSATLAAMVRETLDTKRR